MINDSIRGFLTCTLFVTISACSKAPDASPAESVPTLRATTPQEARAIRDSVRAAQIEGATESSPAAAAAAYDSAADARAESALFAKRSQSMGTLKQCLAQLTPDLAAQSRKTIEAACRRIAARK